MTNKKYEILARTIEQDQFAVAKQWANTFIYNGKNDIATNMTQLLLASLACGDFRIRPYLSKSTELKAPSEHLNSVDYLSHASRVILDYEGLTGDNREELLKFFPAPGIENNVFSRSATHDARRSNEGKVVEGKGFLLGLIGQLPGVLKLPQDFGVNIAMGGEGQENFYGKKITANGYSGHFYFHRNDNVNLLMLGLEQSAPASSALEFVWGTQKYPDDVQQNHDQFDQGHSLVGASDTYTAAGSLYFSDPIYQAKLLLEKGVFPPDKYGAMQVRINDANWPHIKHFFETLRAQSDEEHKDQLLSLLQSKPSTATKTKDEYLSYIALDFDSYLKRVYQMFISDSDLDTKSRASLLESQIQLLAIIKKLQQGHIDNYELFKQQIAEIIDRENSPLEYKQALARIQQLFELQLQIDPKLNQTHQELLFKNQYDDLQEESKIILEKLIELQKHFYDHPPTENQKELEAFLMQIDRQIRELQNPFGPSSEEPIDMSSSWVLCDSPVVINMDSIDKLKQIIEHAKSLIKPSVLNSNAEISFSEHVLTWQEKLLPLSQINLIDYTELDLTKLAQQFNKHVDYLAQQAERLNLWEHNPSQTTNLLVAYSDKNPEYVNGHAFVAQYRESTILKRLFTLDPIDLCTYRFKPYEEPNAKCSEQLPESYWAKISTLHTAGSDVIALLRTLKSLQKTKASWEEISRTANLFQQAVARLKISNDDVSNHLKEISQTSLIQVFESPFFYPISNEALQEMSGAQLATVCLEELNVQEPSALVKRITTNADLWLRMETALQEPALKGRKDNIEQKIATLSQIRHFWEVAHQFKENNNLELKEKHLVELRRIKSETSSILGADQVINEAQTELTQQREFLFLLQNLATDKDQNAALQVLEQKYQNLAENKQIHYTSQLIGAREAVCQGYLAKINDAQTVEEKQVNFQILNQLFGKLSPDSKEKLKNEYEVKQKENSLYELHNSLAKANSVNAKQQIFKSEVFTTTIQNFEQLSSEQSAACAKKAHKQIKLAKVVYDTLDIHIIGLESPSILVDAFINQLLPILDGIEETYQNQLITAMLQDEILKQSILKSGNKKLSSALILDVLSLKKFRDDKIALSETNKYGSEYDQSINQFYQKALDIRLSEIPLKEQVEKIIDTAKTEFKQRHDAFRLVADVTMIVTAFVGVGILIGLGRLALGKTLFFSSYLNDIKTDREVELTNDWLVKELPEVEKDATRLIAAPAA